VEDNEELAPVAVIETIPDLEHLARELVGVDRVAVDLESDSFYAYHEKVCLLQLSSPYEDFIVDPLATRDLSPLGPMFRDPAIEKVFHAGEYDLICLKRDYGFDIANIFDTMVAARTLGAKELGLAALVNKHFNVVLSKKLQRSDWGKRPLTQEQYAYARLDTHYLLELRDILHKELAAKDRLRDARDEFERVVRVQPPEREFDPNAFWRLAGARELTPAGRAVLKGIYLFRERTASELDKAAFRVLPEPLMVRLAAESPRDLDALQRMRGMTPYLFSRYGKDLLAAVGEGLAAEPVEREPERRQNKRWDLATMRRYETLRQWRKKKAEEGGVDTVVILPTDDLRTLAQVPERVHYPEQWLEALTPRKRELYGPEILEILAAPLPETAAAGTAAGGRRRRRRRRGGGSGGPANGTGAAS